MKIIHLSIVRFLMPSTKRDVDNLETLVENASKSLQQGLKEKEEIVEFLKSNGMKPDLRVDAIQYQLVHLYNLCVSFILIKDNLLHFSWWDRYFPGIPDNDKKMKNADRFFEMTLYGTFLGSFSHLESFIRSMHFALDKDRTVKRYESLYKIRKSLFDNYLNINFSELNSFFALMQTLRNCMHNHGVYYDYRFPIDIITFRSVSYEFKNDIPPNYLQPEFLIERIDDSIEIIRQVATAPKSLSVQNLANNYDAIVCHETAC